MSRKSLRNLRRLTSKYKLKSKRIRKNLYKSFPKTAKRFKSNVSKTYKNFRKYLIGGNNLVTCCMCNKKVNIKDTLIPRECLKKHGAKAHRICQSCWWDPISGFSLENLSHKCPGCQKKIPLTKIDYDEVIEL